MSGNYLKIQAMEAPFKYHNNDKIRKGDIVISIDDGEFEDFLTIREAQDLRDLLNTQILKATDMQRRKDKK